MVNWYLTFTVKPTYHPYSRLGQSENKDHPPTQEEIQEVNVSDSETQNTTVHFRFGPYCRFMILEISVGCHVTLVTIVTLVTKLGLAFL